MDPHLQTPLHWGYSAASTQNTWIPPPTRKLKRAISESDCEDIYSEESSKEQTSPGESDSCQMLSRKKRRGVIEKKRRDRINSSLYELKRLVPSAYEKQGSAKLEKAEILQLTVDHLKSLHSKGIDSVGYDPRYAMDYHVIGFRECASEVARYLVTMEGMDIQDPLRLRLMSHLQCFAAQRELSLKTNNTTVSSPAALPPGSIAGTGTALMPTAVVNPISPMGHSGTNSSALASSNSTHSNWMSASSTTASYHHQSQTTAYQMPPSYHHQNAYSSSQATVHAGYVPNLPSVHHHQYEHYNLRSSVNSTTAATIEGGSYDNTDSNNNTSAPNNSNEGGSNNNGSNVASNSTSDSTTTVQQPEQHVPTYTDLSSSSSTSASAGHRSNNNYYGSIHYPVATSDTVSGHHHHLYSVVGDNNNNNNGTDQSRSGGGGVYNSKPYRPWGAEMAY